MAVIEPAMVVSALGTSFDSAVGELVIFSAAISLTRWFNSYVSVCPDDLDPSGLKEIIISKIKRRPIILSFG